MVILEQNISDFHTQNIMHFIFLKYIAIITIFKKES